MTATQVLDSVVAIFRIPWALYQRRGPDTTMLAIESLLSSARLQVSSVGHVCLQAEWQGFKGWKKLSLLSPVGLTCPLLQRLGMHVP